MKEVIDQLRAEMPALFPGTAIGKLTGGAANWGTLSNKKSKGEIPDDCFLRSGPRVLIVRDRFLDWWSSTLQPARATNEKYRLPPTPHAGRRQREADQPEATTLQPATPATALNKPPVPRAERPRRAADHPKAGPLG